MTSEPYWSRLTIEEAAALADLPAKELARRCASGTGPLSVVLPGGRRIRYDDLAEWFDDKPLGSDVRFTDSRLKN